MIYAVGRVFHRVGSKCERELVHRLAGQYNGAERPRPLGGSVPREPYFRIIRAAQIITRPSLCRPTSRSVGILLVHELAALRLRFGEPCVFHVNIAVGARHTRIGKQTDIVHDVENLPINCGNVKGIGDVFSA